MWKKWSIRNLSLNEFFFSEGIQKLVDHWTKNAEKDGDYTENVILVTVLFNKKLIADTFWLTLVYTASHNNFLKHGDV
jgi:hypothetical protein